MKRQMAVLAMAAAAGLFAACGGGDNHGHGNDGHSHGNESGHGHEHEGERVVLGKNKIGDLEVTVAQFGKVAKGKEGVFEINTGASADDNKKKKVFVWIGDKDGKELTPRTTPDYAAEHNDFDGHVEVARDLPADARLWVEIDGAKASWDFKRE